MTETVPARAMAKNSRQLDPIYRYRLSFPNPKNHNYMESLKMSQCVGGRDVDWFTYYPYLPYNICAGEIWIKILNFLLLIFMIYKYK